MTDHALNRAVVEPAIDMVTLPLRSPKDPLSQNGNQTDSFTSVLSVRAILRGYVHMFMGRINYLWGSGKETDNYWMIHMSF